MQRSKTFTRYKLYQVPLFLSWLMSSTHCAANLTPAAEGNAALASSAGTGLAANGAYQLINVKSHMALDLLDSGIQNGNPVVTHQPSDAASQRWSLRANIRGAYALINAQSQQALGLYEGLSTPGTPVQAWSDQQGRNQQWQVTAQSNDVYQVISVASGECLDLTAGAAGAGAHVQQWTCHGQSEAMLWQLVAVDGTSRTNNGNSVASADANADPAGGYTAAQPTTDMSTVLQNRTPICPNRNMGNPSHIAMWTPAKIQSLLNGMITAHDVFYSNINFTDLAHSIIAEGAQESTGNYSLLGWSEGFILSTPSTVGQDLISHGQAVTSPAGTFILPDKSADYDDPGQNIATWA